MLAEVSAHVAAVLILLTLALMLAAPLGYRLHLWSALTALTRIVAFGLVAGVLAALLAVVSLAAGGWRAGPGTTIMLLAIILIGAAAAALPLRTKKRAEKMPFNDVSTDTENPPTFDALLPLRRGELPDATGAYDRARLAALQQRTYPDLAPLRLAAAPAGAFVQARDAAGAMGWTIVAEDAGRGRIEAYDTTRWYGFTDDIVIRLTADNGGTRIDLRSASRVGISDLGKNAARIRAYLAALARRAG